MKLTLFFTLLFSSCLSFAQVDAKKLASEMSVMTRSMDLLFAREEMKDSTSVKLIRNLMHTASASEATTEVDKKVKMMTDEQGLQGCQISHNETRSAAGDQTDALVEYKGADCPFSISATIHIVSNQTGADGDVNMQVEIVSPKLKAEIDMAKFTMPMKIKVVLAQSDQGFTMNMNMGIGAKILSQALGPVDYTADMVTNMIFGQSMKMNTSSTEVYSSSGKTLKFVATAEANNNDKKESYSVDDVTVSKADFDQKHSAVSMPGFDDQKTPLARAELCDIKTYDSAVYGLDTVRQNIKNGTADSMQVSENLQPVYLMQTGKMTSPVMMANQSLELEVATTPDAVRFNFQKQGQQGAPPEFLGRLTAVLGEKVELSKIILNRVVRVTCTPQ